MNVHFSAVDTYTKSLPSHPYRSNRKGASRSLFAFVRCKIEYVAVNPH